MAGVELDSLITSVKDLLPELGDGFIEVSDQLSYLAMDSFISSTLKKGVEVLSSLFRLCICLHVYC